VEEREQDLSFWRFLKETGVRLSGEKQKTRSPEAGMEAEKVRWSDSRNTLRELVLLSVSARENLTFSDS
jgi:hypothetical protein